MGSRLLILIQLLLYLLIGIKNHNDNFHAALPINKNGDFIFKENGFKYLTIDEVFEKCIDKGVTKISKIDNLINKFK